MALQAYDINAALPAHVPDQGRKENARIIGVFLVKKGFNVTTLTEDDTTWTAAITAGDVVIINPVTGSFPESSKNEIPGIGRTQTEYSHSTYTPTFRHKNADDNLAFYNKLLKSKQYGAGFVFHDNRAYIPLNGTVGDPDAIPIVPDSFEVQIIDFYPRIMADGEQLEGDRFLMCDCTFVSSDLPYVMDIPESLFPL